MLEPYVQDSDFTLYVGDVRDVLKTLEAVSVDCCVTSPPYWGLRDYGNDGQIGLEQTPDAFVAELVDVFREVRRVLSDTGTLWLNLGDSYANDTKWGGSTGGKHAAGLHAAGGTGRGPDGRKVTKVEGRDGSEQHRNGERWPHASGRNIRSVWDIATQPYPDAHFATFPEALPERCIKAGCPEGGVVLEPFMGSGTTALVARRLGRRSIGIELNQGYADLCARRLQQLSLLAEPAA